MPAGCGYPRLGSVGVNLIADPRRISGLRIDQLHIRNIQPRFLIYDPTAAIARRFLMTLDHGCAFDFYFATRWCDGEHATALASVAAGNHDDLIVLLYFGSLSSFHRSPQIANHQLAPLNNFRRQRYDLHEILIAQLTRDRTEHTRPDWRAILFNQYRSVLIKADVGSVLAPHFLARAHNDRILNGSFLDGSVR